ncbi:PTN18 phosphatase, partial [Amia calva]|nr:PTN18 phosphatase [Amia calva]
MVWQYRVKVIIMACREIEMGKKKCEPYWAAYTETATFGPFVVSNVAESQPSEEVVVRTLVAKFQGEVRTISQFQYTAWPDHGIPSAADGILGMMEMVHAAQGGDTSPILVHCSAGCGRTGVICTVDYIHDLLHTKRINDSFSIKDIVMEIRRQRPSAVQTKEQYEFVYHTVAQMFQKALDSDRHNYENLSEVYDDVGTVSRPAPDHCPAHPSKPPAKSKPALKPRTSLPPKEQKMNDTYAVVNKLKNRLPPATAPASTVHHYDNADQGSPRPSGTALYTAVKPKPRFGNSPTAPPKPIYATAAPSNQTRANGSFGRSSVLEPVSYDIGGEYVHRVTKIAAFEGVTMILKWLCLVINKPTHDWVLLLEFNPDSHALGPINWANLIPENEKKQWELDLRAQS